jgi:flagellar biosynthesis activator protein FlaF
VTARLTRATDPATPMAQRAAALHDNRQLWITLATDLASADNALPQGLRAQLFYLAEFSLLQSSQALRDHSALTALIDINKAVMRGLDGVATSS